jgi:Xaa-Pro aminopeptidase
VGDMDNIYIIVTAKEVHGFADSRDILTLKKYNFIESHVINEYTDVIKFFKTLKISKLLIEGDLTLMDFDSYIKPLNVLTKTINMKEVRSIKSESEIAIMQESANIACDCIAYVKKNIKVGMTEEQVAQMTKVFMISAGASELSFSSIISFGENSADIHHAPSATRKLKTGEIIMLDIGCIYKGYCSDITRCF